MSCQILINDMAEYFKEEGENGEFLSACMKLCYLVHWAVFVNMMNLLDRSQLIIFKKKFPSGYDLNQICKLRVSKVIMAGDSIVRHLKSKLINKTEVICAPGVHMCTPHKDKWMNRLWKPLKQQLDLSVKCPLVIFHLGTNNVSSLKGKASGIILQEAKELCEKVWNVNVNTKIVFSAVLKRKEQDEHFVDAVNLEIEKFLVLDPRISMINLNSTLVDKSLFKRDQIHLSPKGVIKFASCLNQFLRLKFK